MKRMLATVAMLVAVSAAGAPAIEEGALKASLAKGTVKVISLERHLGPPEVPEGAFARACRNWNLTKDQVLELLLGSDRDQPGRAALVLLGAALPVLGIDFHRRNALSVLDQHRPLRLHSRSVGRQGIAVRLRGRLQGTVPDRRLRRYLIAFSGGACIRTRRRASDARCRRPAPSTGARTRDRRSSRVISRFERIMRPSTSLPSPTNARLSNSIDQLAVRLVRKAVGRHDADRKARVHRNVLPATFDAAVVLIREAAEVRHLRARVRVHDFLHVQADHLAIGDEVLGDHRLRIRRRTKRRLHRPGARAPLQLLFLGPGSAACVRRRLERPASCR